MPRARNRTGARGATVGEQVTARLFVVCDYAAVSPDGKLHIMGANIDQMFLREFPGPVGQAYLAALLSVPWNETSEQHSLRIRLLDSDRNPVGLDPLLEAQAEIGRPPGARPGDAFGLPVAVPFGGIEINAEVSAYFHLEVDDRAVASHPFRFRLALPGMLPPAPK
jgi:hypothetical protein